jgi:hypothetical protein
VVGERVAAALTGTLLGIFAAYGFVNPLANRIKFNDAADSLCLRCIKHRGRELRQGPRPADRGRDRPPVPRQLGAAGRARSSSARQGARRDQVAPPAMAKKEAHHGGAWKVAYADFVTAMMALFMVLWISRPGQKDPAGDLPLLPAAVPFARSRTTRGSCPSTRS